jgi:rhodanese-related sulfurtransferase
MPQLIPEISVEEVGRRLQEKSLEKLQLIDVREPQEMAIASLPYFEIFPLSKFDEWSGEISTRLDPHAETLVLCHHGMRSAQMCQWLIHQGFTNVKNIVGGIDYYAIKVDRSIPRY